MAKSKRVLFAITNLTYGGIQTQALNLAKGFSRKGFKIYFFYTDRYEKDFVDKELNSNNFQVIDGSFLTDQSLLKFSWKLNRYWPILKAIIILKSYRINYVIPYQNKLSYFFGAIHKYSGVQETVFHIRNTVLENKPKKNWYLDYALKNKPKIIANSNHARLKFEEVYGGKYKLNIHTINNGLEIKPIGDIVNWKSHFEIESVDFAVSVIANFFNEKDYITIFKAWKGFLDATNSNSKLLIAGDDGIDGQRKFYENKVKSMGLEESVVFLGRISETIELLSVTNCNVLSTKSEGLPNVAIETLAVGKPFLGTDIDGVREVVGKNYPISLFEVGDNKKLLENFLKIYNNEIDLEHLKNYSLYRFKKFSAENLLSSYLKLLDID